MSKEWARDDPNPVVRWIFLTGSRLRVAAVLSLLFIVLTALLIELGLVYVGPGSNLSTALSSGMLSGLLTLLTVALSINQLILSRLFGSAGSLSEQLESTLDYRRSVEDIADVAVSPNEPSAFLTFLADTLKRRLGDFRHEAASTAVAFDVGDDPEAYVSAVSDYAEHLSTAEELDDPFEVLLLALGEDYAEHLNTTREFQARYGQRLPDETAEVLDDVLELLKGIATMRQFFKTLTLQQELARLSRELIYSGVPAILVTYFLSFVYTSASDMSTAIDPAVMPIVVAVATGVILSPLAVLVASLLRIATVSLYSVSVGTFTPPQETFESG
ncbi:hypothetical protein [Natrinema salaciae]|uniref:Uncharacterized protein n=1 Tax=Natrinema salaciae TaxID=1186196 RepID=A0A1H9R0N7_9EURY|nr:hypothetical protein [Natrinema salaciae]SER66401.1 hypothetical protein SAMN04489841_4240 [Natrinema salaciae]